MNNRNHTCSRLASIFGLLVLGLALAGCGGGSDSSSGPSVGTSQDVTQARPVISGTPASAVVANAHYQFFPRAVSYDGAALVYSIQNQPRWATFDAATGILTGNPGASDVGSYPNIVISASDGTHTAALPPFSIVVSMPAGASSSSGGTASSSGSSSSSGASSGGAPTAAAAVGFNTMTFGPAVKLKSNWFPFEFYGYGTQPADYATQNSDGSLYLSGNEHPSGGGVSSAAQTHSGKNWTGTAFGGGGYFEAVLSFTGQGSGPYNNGGPTFWALDIEHTSQGPYDVSWPGQHNNSSGHPYDDYYEVDFMEYDASTYAYQNGIGNWYGYPPAKSTSNPHDEVGGSAGSVLVPSGTNFAEYHTYGCLWVIATPSTQGYLKFYFDGTQTGQTFYWNYNNPHNPFPPPPQNNSTAMSGMDARHLMLILGTGTDQPMTVKSVTVWQASGANNLTY